MSIRFNHRTGLIETTGASGLVVFDNGGTDSVSFSHDGTDLNIAGTNTTDINITGITALQAGTVDADFDAITATSYGGITEANLLDKTATESISGAYTFTNATTTFDNGAATQTVTIGNAGLAGEKRFRLTNASHAAGKDFVISSAADTYGIYNRDSTRWDLQFDNSANTADFGSGAVTAASFGGIASANLLDKTATETISGSYTFSAATTFSNASAMILTTAGNGILLYDNVQATFGLGGDLAMKWDGTDFEVTGLASNQTINLRDGHHLALWDSTDTDNVDFHHDGTDFNITATNTTAINITGASLEVYGDGTATDLHYLGIDANNRLRIESGTNYGMLLYEDDNVSTETSAFYIGNDTVSTGVQSIFFRKGGSDWFQADNFGSASRFEFTGPLEIAGTTDHVGDTGAGTGVSSDRIQIWSKIRTLDHEPMITTGDQDLDYTFTNIIPSSYHFDQTITAADPGAGNLRWNSATPASVTNWYVDDLESTGRDASFMLANLASGDIVTLRSQWNTAAYMVASVNGTPTDNTGYWTIPVTVIHSGSLPATGDPVHLSVEWMSQAPGGGGISGTVANDQIVVGTGASTVDSSSALTFNGSAISTTGRFYTSAASVGGADGSSIVIDSSNPQFSMQNTGAAANTGVWNLIGNTTNIALRTLDDAYANPVTALQFDRTGTTVDSMTVPPFASFQSGLEAIDAAGGTGVFLESTVSESGAGLNLPFVRWREADQTTVAAIRAAQNAGSTIQSLVLGTGFFNTKLQLNSDDEHTMTGHLTVSGTGNELTMNSAAPKLKWIESDATANNGWWDMVAAGEQMLFRIRGDADVGGANIFTVDRTTTSVDNITFYQPTYISGFSGETMVIKSNVAGGNSLNNWIQWKDSGNVDQAYIGFGSAANETFYINNQSGGDILLNTGGDVDITCPATGALEITGSSFKTNPTGIRVGQYTSTRVYVQAPAGGQVEIWDDGTVAIATFNDDLTTDFAGAIYPGGQTIGNITAVTGNYGSVQCNGADGSSGSYAGWSIDGNLVLMLSGTTGGIYDDVNNHWKLRTDTTSNATTGKTSSAQVYDHANGNYDVGFNVLPTFNFNVSDTLEATHCGKVTGKTNTSLYTLTGPTSSDLDWPVGGVTTVMNLGTSGNYLISDTTTCTMYILEGDGTAPADIVGTCTLGPGGVCTLYRYSTTAIYIWGSGLTL